MKMDKYLINIGMSTFSRTKALKKESMLFCLHAQGKIRLEHGMMMMTL
nr:hypothetical protein EC90111_5705 [Escherichia coli 9.0111]